MLLSKSFLCPTITIETVATLEMLSLFLLNCSIKGNLFHKKFFESMRIFFYLFFVGLPHLATYFFLILPNEPGLGAGIDPGMALTPFLSNNLDKTRFETTT